MTDPTGAEAHPVFALSDRFVDEYAALSPMTATALGVSGHDDRWDDTSPEGAEAMRSFLESARAEARRLPPTADRWARLALRIFDENAGLELDTYEHGDHLHQTVNHLAGLFPALRDTFDVMDRGTTEGWRNVATRLATIGEPLAGWRASLTEGMRRDLWAPRRQAESMVDQLRASVAPDGSFTGLVAGFADAGVDDDGIRDALREALGRAGEAVEETARWFEREYLPGAPDEDAVGEERYARRARRFLGTTVDLHETYRWGWDHLLELWSEMQQVAREVDPDRDLRGVVEVLESDPAHSAATQEEFRLAMLERARQALRELDGTHFTIPDEIREIDVRLAPKGNALGAYYVPPSEDFTRCGTTWWSLGDAEPVPLWDEVTTAYHEGFPGHHLQCGLQVTLGDRLSRVHRLLFWLSGYGEGWALYAERLMRELGYFDRPEYVLGLLASNALRAVRVCIDIGSHLRLPIPADVPFHPGEEWTYDLAVEALEHFAFNDHALASSEVTRYLGWPGQAISYKVGEREILRLRDEVRAREGSAFDLRAFHEQVLGSGPVGLDHLRELVLG
ncbi:MAG: DUF885 domain-containing protein [Actinobacteria bacterium]|nr:DUF885 domain-containing protein [Actinomycetota bacterium]